MADIIDMTQDREEGIVDAAVSEISKKAAQIPAGVPGECELCGEDSPRLVGNACARCRDKYKLP